MIRRLAGGLSFLRHRVALMVLGYTITIGFVTFLRHYALFSYAWDLGIFNQAFWSTVNGRSFFYTVEPWFGESFFAVHFSPILIFLVPIYAVCSRPETLLVLQSFIIALGIVPLYFLAKDKLGDRSAFLLAASYMMNPMVLGANFYDFHFEAFIPVTLFSTIYFLEKRNFKFYTLSLLLSLMVHEYMAVFTILLMVYEISIRIRSKVALRKIAAYAILTIVLSALWLLSAAAIHSYLRKPETASMNIVSPILSDVGEPAALLSRLGYDFPQKLLYVGMLLAPLLFAPLLSSYMVLSVPWLLFAFLLNYRPYYTLSYQYSLLLLPFVYVSAIRGVAKVRSGVLKNVNLGRVLLLSALVFFVLSLTLVQAQLFDLKRADSAQRVLQLVPANASVLATNNLFPHVSSRFDVWVLPFDYDEPYPSYYSGISSVWKDYARKILNEKTPEFLLLDLRTESVRNLKLIASELLSREAYGVYASIDGILLLKRGYTAEPLIFTPWESLFNYATLTLHDGARVPDSSSQSGQVLVHATNDFDNATCWSSPIFAVPPGEYLVSFRLKLANTTTEIDVVTLSVATDEMITSSTVLNSTCVSSSDLDPGAWTTVTLGFSVKRPDTIQIKGLKVSNAVSVYLDYVEVVQLGCEVG